MLSDVGLMSCPISRVNFFSSIMQPLGLNLLTYSMEQSPS